METKLNSLKALLDSDLLPGLCNATSYLYYISENLNWLGFYFYQNGHLSLGPFQGKVACSPLTLDKGVCAKAFVKRQIINVSDVHNFEGHIACDENSKSELVLPLIWDGKIYGVLDIDAPIKNRFNKEDETFFAKAASIIAEFIALKTNSGNFT